MIGGTKVLPNAAWLDPIGGLVISLMVIQAGFGNTIASLYELADIGVDDSIKKKTARATEDVLEEIKSNGSVSGGLKGVPQVNVRSVSGRKAGQSYLLDVELGVAGSTSVHTTQQIEAAVRSRIGLKVRGAKRVKVRFVARDDEETPAEPSIEDEFVMLQGSPESSPEPEEAGHHRHGHGHGHGHSHKH